MLRSHATQEYTEASKNMQKTKIKFQGYRYVLKPNFNMCWGGKVQVQNEAHARNIIRNGLNF